MDLFVDLFMKTYLTYFIVPIYMLVVFLIGILKYNEKIKKAIMIVLSCIYNLYVGFWGQVICFAIACIPNLKLPPLPSDVYIVMIYLILLIPLNAFMNKEGNINVIIYIILSILTFTLGFYCGRATFPSLYS